MLEITTKRQLRKMWQSSRDPRTKRLYNAQSTYVKNLLNEHRQTQWNAFTETLNFKNKSLYQLNRRLLKKKAADTPLQTSTGHKIFEADEKAELSADTMENQFIGNAGIDLQEVNETITEINLDQTTSNTYINPKQVLDIINKLPNGKSPGYDNISNTALKNVPHNIITQLAHIFTSCLRISYFPKIWKKATIVMIPKPGKNHSIPENHRPISLLSTISKVYEKIILKTLRIYIKPRAEQHAFREDHSTTTQLFHLFKEIKNNQKQKKYTAATFLDMKKAFDRVWHDGLIYKLKTNTRLPINMIKLIKSFLSDRSFQVRVVDQQSTTRQIQAGVSQGSCLSPLLYIQYVNDLPLLDKIQTSIFADDTMFHTAHKNRNFAICQLQRQLDQTVIWIDRWRLKLNIDKTEAIIFGSRQNKHLRQIKIKNQTIKWKNQIKYLGVTMDSKLTMNGLTKTTTQKAKGVRASLYPILNQKSPIPLRARIQLYTIYSNQFSCFVDRKIIGSLLVLIVLLFVTFFSSMLCKGEREVDVGLLLGQTFLELQPIRSTELLPVVHKRCVTGSSVEVCEPTSVALSFEQSEHQHLPVNSMLGIGAHEPLIQREDNTSTQIYTDASKTEMGIGLAIAHLNETKQFKLNIYNSIYTAEYLALYKGVQLALQIQDTKIDICSDSLSALANLQSIILSEPLAILISNLLSKSSKDIQFVWIPGHCNIKGNEKADEAARNAIMSPNSELIPFSSLVDIKRNINKYCVEWWNSKWHNTSENKLREIKHSVELWPKYTDLNRKNEIHPYALHATQTTLSNTSLSTAQTLMQPEETSTSLITCMTLLVLFLTGET
ncbi:hypothetical protein QTP88_005583 [Uroleucon formosanum]